MSDIGKIGIPAGPPQPENVNGVWFHGQTPFTLVNRSDPPPGTLVNEMPPGSLQANSFFAAANTARANATKIQQAAAQSPIHGGVLGSDFLPKT